MNLPGILYTYVCLAFGFDEMKCMHVWADWLD